MYMDYVSIYHLWFILSEFYKFLYIDLVHILLSLYLSIILLSFMVLIYVVFCFLFKIPVVNYWYIRKQLAFVINLVTYKLAVIVLLAIFLLVLYDFLHRQLYHLWTMTNILPGCFTVVIFGHGSSISVMAFHTWISNCILKLKLCLPYRIVHVFSPS
jgi:hypothetical protein